MKRVWTLLAALVIGGLVVGAGYVGYVRNRPNPIPPPGPLTIAVTTCDVQQTVTAPGRLVNLSTTSVAMPFDGQLAEVRIRAGDAVSTGQVLARLANPAAYTAAEAAAQLELAQAQQTLAALIAGAPLQAAQAHLAYLEAQQDLAQAQRADRARLARCRVLPTSSRPRAR